MVVSEIDLSSPLNYGTPTSHGGLAGVGIGSQGSVRTPGVRGTPIRIRSDIQSEKRLRQINVRGTPGGNRISVAPSSEIGAAQENGTNVEGGGPPRSDSFVAPSEASSAPVDGLVI